MRPSAEELYALYVTGRLTTRQIGSRLGVSKTSVQRWLIRDGVVMRAVSRGVINRGMVPPTSDELHDLVHVQHLTYRQIGEKYEVAPPTIGDWLNKHGIPRPTVSETVRLGRPIIRPTTERLRAMYDATPSAMAVGAALGESEKRVLVWLREAGINVGKQGFDTGRWFACVDGHRVRSQLEQRVDNWLAERGIEHTPAPVIPGGDARMNVLRADFLAGGVYIEVYGVKRLASYQSKRDRKRLIYQRGGTPFLELMADDFKGPAWEEKLETALAVAGRARTP